MADGEQRLPVATTKPNVISSALTALLRIDFVRHWFVRLRHARLKGRMKFLDGYSESVGAKTIEHNLSAFLYPGAAFGCGGRMGLLIHPVLAYYSNAVIDRAALKVLIVGCRTEDDVYWMKSYGFGQTWGLDLFSYSQHVLLGDIHGTQFPNGTFDVVLLGWMISYTADPRSVFRECLRILKPGALLGVGLEHNPKQDTEGLGSVRVNPLNSTPEVSSLLAELTRYKTVFDYDHHNEGDAGAAVVYRVLPQGVATPAT